MNLAKKILLSILFCGIFAQGVFAAKFSNEMKEFIEVQFPYSVLRFDGLITLSDGTLYLPLYPALVKTPDKIEVKEVISVEKGAKHPEIIILNNDYVFMKVIKNSKGQNSLLYLKNPPLEVKTGLLPQDMLVPSGLYVPDNIKGIIGNLNIPTIEDNDLKVEVSRSSKNKNLPNYVIKDVVDVLKHKVFYIVTCSSKDIQVVKSDKNFAQYALEQDSMVYDFKQTPDNKFILVTKFNDKNLDVISLADDMKIKQIDLTSNGGDILINPDKNVAYVASPDASCLYILDLKTMTLTQKVKLKGKCTKLILADKNRKIFYFDKKTNEVWSVELDNDYITKYIGSFPNISKIEYGNGKVYLSSRIASRIAIVDYNTLNLIAEIPVKEKPVDMMVYKNYLYILSATTNTIQILDILKDEFVGDIALETKGFSTKMYLLDGTSYVLVADAAANLYSIVDFDKNILIKNYPLNVFVSKMLILPEVRKN